LRKMRRLILTEGGGKLRQVTGKGSPSFQFVIDEKENFRKRCRQQAPRKKRIPVFRRESKSNILRKKAVNGSVNLEMTELSFRNQSRGAWGSRGGKRGPESRRRNWGGEKL